MQIKSTDVGDLSFPDNDSSINHFSHTGVYDEYLLTDAIDQSLDKLPPNSLFVDIGANVGYYTRFAASRVTRVLAVEASLETYNHLITNTSNFNNVLPLWAMAWDINGVGELFLNPSNSADHRAFNVDGRECEYVAQTRMDYLLNNYEKAHGPVSNLVVKIDTQGADHRVLEGFGHYRDMISHCFVECWPYGLHNLDGLTINDLLSLYEEMDFEIFPIEKELDLIDESTYANLHLRRSLNG